MGIHRFAIEGTQYEVNVGRRAGNSVRVEVNGQGYDVALEGPAGAGAAASSPSPTPSAAPAAAPAGSSGGEVRAPISGVVLSTSVDPGQKVVPGSVLLILEAMKMENEIVCYETGTVVSVNVKPQQDVREGDLLVVIKPG